MSVLFEPVKIGTLEIKNRFVRSATYYALSDADGFIGQASIDLLKTLAANEVGLIMTGYAYVLKSGQSFPDMNGIQDDDHIPGFQKMTGAIHEAGGRVAMQIAHCGAASETTARTGGDYLAVSLVDRMPDYGKKAREMNEEDIENIIEAFGQAARRVQEAGFDGVQIHGAHGYLVSQFLSPVSNRRNDKWGGSLENRMRFVIEVTRAIKKEVGQDFPVMIKLGVRDYLEEGPGLTVEEGAEVAKALEKEGVCFIEISNGIQDAAFRNKFAGITSPEKEAYYLPSARVIRAAATVPLSLVGGMRSLPVMEEIIRSGVVDCISMCRPLIREPGLIKRWKEGDTRAADCISCWGCFNLDEQGKRHIYCRQLKKD
ncbi:MAG: NADH:flavin oxidoreductase [Deltaproteobacteria bacterium]|nr:NADH:flavin oxidoreductase [Deltaproteobacteria bacterium]